MRAYLVIFALLLVVPMAPLVAAADTTDATSVLDQQNKFLAAEVSREIRTGNDQMLTQMKDYQDENFRIFDARMAQFMTDTKTKMALGAIGAALIANAIIALFLFRVTKRYSYEKYLEDRLAQYKDNGDTKQLTPGIAKMQEQEWRDHVPTPTMGMVYGQAEAAQMSEMNRWQTQPAYDGAWQAPVAVQQEYTTEPGGYYKADPNDPMESPGWNPGGGY